MIFYDITYKYIFCQGARYRSGMEHFRKYDYKLEWGIQGCRVQKNIVSCKIKSPDKISELFSNLKNNRNKKCVRYGLYIALSSSANSFRAFIVSIP
jgi:hypothetical protein